MKSSIGWLIPSLIEGSGGIRVIFNMINALVAHGYECHAYVDEKDTAEAIADQIDCFYGGSQAFIHSGHKLEHEHDLVFATIWWSAQQVASTPGLHAYLIQDYEAFFNPMGDGFLMAQQSYQMGLMPVTLGRWLPTVLASRYGVRARYADFCAETDLYRPLPGAKREPRSVCFIHQPEKPRRCADLGLKALALLKQAAPDVKIYLYGANAKAKADFDHVNLGILHGPEINRLYNEAGAGFCISASNPSRIPFEMMAAGLPVVDIWRDNNLYDFPEEGLMLAEPTPEGMARALQTVLDDPALQQSMSAAGPQFMSGRSMLVEYTQFLEAVDRMFDGTFQQDLPETPQRSYRRLAISSQASLPV